MHIVIIKPTIIITNQMIIAVYENISKLLLSIWILRISHPELPKISDIPRISQMIIKADIKNKSILKNFSMLVNSPHFFLGFSAISIVKAREIIQVINQVTSQVLFISYFINTHSLSDEFKKLSPKQVYLFHTVAKKMTK